jgi:transposase-like protein
MKREETKETPKKGKKVERTEGTKKVAHRTTYSEEYKLKVLGDMVATGASVEEISRRYSLAKMNIYRWSSTFGIEIPQLQKSRIMSQDASELEKRVLELERELSELRIKYQEKEVEAAIRKGELDYVCAKYHIELKKKTDLE